jgi:hypothetical protein
MRSPVSPAQAPASPNMSGVGGVGSRGSEAAELGCEVSLVDQDTVGVENRFSVSVMSHRGLL